MIYADFTLMCRFTAPARTSSYKGSALRGMFGRALRRASCALRRMECRDCMLAGNCAYFQLFESLPVRENGRRPPTPVHPYVIFPHLDDRCEYQEGDGFSFQLLLFGRKALDLFPHVVFSVSEMGRMGFGRRDSDHPGGFVLERVVQDGRDLLGSGGVLDRPQPMTLELLQPQEPCRRLRVDFVTPFRVKHRNRFQDRPAFHLVARAALRRVAELEELFGEGEPALDYRGLVAAAGAVDADLAGCRWHDMVRRSSRQQRVMKYGGITGTAVYQGELTPYLPLLRYCENTHLGKMTAFGLGRIELEALE